MRWLRTAVIRHDAAIFAVIAAHLKKPWALVWDLGHTGVYRFVLQDDHPETPYRYHLEWHVDTDVLSLRMLDPTGEPFETVASWYLDEDIPEAAAWIVAEDKRWPRERLVMRRRQLPWHVRFGAWLARRFGR